MEEKKHIDRLYQEKFKDFEATPREAVWKNISSRLKEKERNRTVAPMWYKLAGVAAVLALFINYASGLFETNSPSPSVATESGSNFGNFTLVSSNFNEKMSKSSSLLQAIINDTRIQQEKQKMLIKNSIAQPLTSTISKPVATPGFLNGNIINRYTFADFNSSGAVMASITTEPSEPEQKKDLSPVKELKKSEEDDLVKKAEPSKKLRVTTTAAPIYYDNLGKGSSIDAIFSNNESSGEVTMAYGINFAYQISEKWKIRSGVSKVGMSQNTRNIGFTAAVNPVALNAIDYNGNIPNYKIENRRISPFSNISASAEFDRASLAAPASGFLNQRIGFIEVPLEVEYAIIDKKVGLNIIGGGSTLFLDENMISLNSADFSTDLGEANNLNQVSFSTNIGVGVDYEITPQFQLNLEPIFKYQINTFNGTNEGLNPYYFGIYSGFSFKF